MSLDKIKESVLNASRTEAQRIKIVAEKEAAAKLEIQKENLRREYEYHYQARARSIEEEYSRKLARQQGSAAKDILEAKNVAIRAIFNKAREIILGSSSQEYKQIMQGLLIQIAKDRSGRVRVHGEDRGLFTGIIEELNAGRSGPPALSLDEGSLPEKGGFIFIGPDYEIDSTIATVLSDIEQELLPEIARDLSKI